MHQDTPSLSTAQARPLRSCPCGGAGAIEHSRGASLEICGCAIHPLRALLEEVQSVLPEGCRVSAEWEIHKGAEHRTLAVYAGPAEKPTLVFWTVPQIKSGYEASFADVERVTREWLAVGQSLAAERIYRCGDCGVAMGPPPALACACPEGAL